MTFQLNPGNRLVVYTDGITEARNPQGDFYAEESLVRTVLAQRSTALNQLPENVFLDVSAWCGPNNKPEDDTTLVAMELEPRD
jgi:serine phosphatase RsbU (regulator of sigma subunit)